MIRQRAAPSIVIVIAALINGITPSQMEVLVNESAFISCVSNEVKSIQWHHTPPKGPSVYVYAGGKFYESRNDRLSLMKDPKTNASTLVITNVTLEDAGLYECKDDVLSGVFGSTHLTVLDSSPVCTSNMIHNGFVGPNTCDLEQERMAFSCTVSFRGYSPILMWRSLNGNHTIRSSDCKTKDNRINCSLSMIADAAFDGAAFICQTITTSSDSRHNCSIEDIKVEYFFADFDTVDLEKTVNDNASCAVTSNLQIQYNWTLQRNEQVTFVSANRTILLEKPGLYECVVEYSIRNATCYHLVAVVNASNRVDDKRDADKHNNSLTLPLLIVIAVSAAAVAAAVVAAVVINAKRKRRNEEKFSPITLQTRLTKICTILQFNSLLNQLVKVKAISEEESKAIEEDVEGNSIDRLTTLITKKNFSLLVKTVGKINATLGRYLKKEKSEIIAVDVNSSIPGLDVRRLSEALNAKQPKLFPELKIYNISVVASSKPENIVKVFIYCSEMKDMMKFTELFNSGELQKCLSKVMNDLLREKTQNDNIELSEIIHVNEISINENEVSAIEKFIDKQDCFCVYTGIGKSRDGSKYDFSVYDLDKIQSDKKGARKFSLPRGPEFLSTGLSEDGNEDESLPSESDRLLRNKTQAELSLTPDKPVITNASEQEIKTDGLDDYISVSDQIALGPIHLKKSRQITNEYGHAVGMTIMKNKLFVVYERCSFIESYSCENYDYADCKKIENMNNPEDIASCPSSLYILNISDDKTKVEILRIDQDTLDIKAKWKIKGSHGRISASKRVIVVSLLHEKVRHVIEYNPDFSSFYRFGINVNAFDHPFRVLKSNSNRFLCLQESAEQSAEVNLFLVDGEGIVLKKTPIPDADNLYAKRFHLITDTNGNAIVADWLKKQISSYDSNLDNGKELISTPYINTPDRIAIDERGERLFVLCWDGPVGSVQIFPITRRTESKDNEG